MSHRLRSIQEAEEKALNHDRRIAQDVYRQNKAVEVQNFVQTFQAETNLFPENVMENISKNEKACRKELDEQEKTRTKNRLENLLKKKELANKRKAEVKGISAKIRISSQNRDILRRVLDYCSDGELANYIEKMSAQAWRNWLVRTVCLCDGKF